MRERESTLMVDRQDSNTSSYIASIYEMMGACFWCQRPKTLKNIRVVHLDGSLEEYEDPINAQQVIRNFPKHFLCTPIEILQKGLVPLKLDHQLKTGQIYFILPKSTLKFNATPADLISLTRKLTNIAKTGQCLPKSVPTSPSASPLPDQKARSPIRNINFDGREKENIGSLYRSPPWKPALATIREGSFNQTS